MTRHAPVLAALLACATASTARADELSATRAMPLVETAHTVDIRIENGVATYPVHEITIAGNLKDMYRNIVAIGSDVDVRGGVRVGSILISEMTIAGE